MTTRDTHPWLVVNYATATDAEAVTCFLAMLESALYAASHHYDTRVGHPISFNVAIGFFVSAGYWAHFRETVSRETKEVE